MYRHCRIALDGQSVLVGIVAALVGCAVLGAAANADSGPRFIIPLRFLVLEATPHGKPNNGIQALRLKLSPHYGKIDKDSLQSRQKIETQELTVLLNVDEGYKIARGDILAFESFKHIRLSPGSTVTRHLPGGGQEQVP